MAFLEYYLQILIFTGILPLALGIAIYFCNRAFCALVGYRRGRPILLVLHVILTPIREFAHLVACMLTFHRVHDFRLLNLYDPEGELGFVEHSYNRKNPIAVLGNYLFAVLPAALFLFVAMLVVMACFRGSFAELSRSVSTLVESEAGLDAYAGLAIDFLPTMFCDSASGIAARIVGSLLLLLLSLGAFVSLDDLYGGISGFFVYAVAALLFAGVTALFDARARRLILWSFRTFATGLAALYLVVLIFAVAMLALALVFFVFRTLFGEERTGLPVYVADKEDYDEYDA